MAPAPANPTRKRVDLTALNEWSTSERDRILPVLRELAPALKHQRITGDGAHVLRFDTGASVSDRLRAIERLRADPRIERIDADRRILPQAAGPITGVLNVLSASPRSWFLKAVSAEPASTNTATLWQRFRGDSRSVVAVVDTGILSNHPALKGHVLPGFDMVADSFTANDNQALSPASSRDTDASDPGNGISLADSVQVPECGGPSGSTWHGSFVAALVAGNPNQTEQVFPINWHGQILPVRALGRCGGFTSDLADAVRWSAGLPVPGTPLNATPADVINLSLGALGPCVSGIEGAAINEANTRGAIVVVAAGNRGRAVDSPANCPGVVAVAALDQEGLKADYSNHGAAITVSAPGGDFAYPIWSASNSGTQGPQNDTYATKVGTSFAAPLVASTISLMRALNPELTRDAIVAILRRTARPFLTVAGNPVCSVSVQSTACNCNTAQCGAGMLDTAAAVFAARPDQVLANLAGPAVVNAGGSGRYDASQSFNPSNGSLNWQWSVVSFSGNTAPVIVSPTASVTDIRFPTGVRAAQIELTVSNGAQSHSILKNISVSSVETAQADFLGALGNLVAGSLGQSATTAGLNDGNTPDSAGNANGSQTGGSPTAPAGGGGGGAFHMAWLLIVALGLRKLRSRSALPV